MMAESYSEDPATTPNGGDLGFVGESSLEKASPELRRLVLSLQPGHDVSRDPHAIGISASSKLISEGTRGAKRFERSKVQQSIRDDAAEPQGSITPRRLYYEMARNESEGRQQIWPGRFSPTRGKAKNNRPALRGEAVPAMCFPVAGNCCCGLGVVAGNLAL